MTEQNNRPISLRGTLKAIGPGILYAGAAIGASHLVFSTRAGADYSFQLIWVIILINLFKYPFFEYAYRYTAATGTSILHGYKKLGRWAILTFFIFSFFTAIVNFAAVTKVTADLASYIFGLNLSNFVSSAALLSLILLILFFGKYATIDKIMKIMIVTLAVFTVTAFFFALQRGQQIQEGFIPPEIWNGAGITFLLAIMGWMPTPIDASVWPSLWIEERIKQTHYTPSLKEFKVDFHIGYIGSAFIALFFLGLGAFVMYGSGDHFSPGGIKFSEQLISLYSTSIGKWSHGIISTIVLITMFSTALTVIDGYPRSLKGSMLLIFPSFEKSGEKIYTFWTLFLAVSAVVILVFFTKDMKSLLEFATILSFLTAPFFAYINFRTVTSSFFPEEFVPKLWLRVLSWAGLLFLASFSLVYIYVIWIK
ncbi:MAG: Nramp family divalent metal transporter [Bacteroidales bacterium]|nr:Nramp family divalent metal transporter [Bacteroidales bacterium]